MKRWKVSTIERKPSETIYSFLSNFESALNELERSGWSVSCQFQTNTKDGIQIMAIVSASEKPIELKPRNFEGPKPDTFSIKVVEDIKNELA